MNKKTIPIFFSADDAFLPFLSVAVDSLLQNASRSYAYRLIVLDGGISEENKIKLEKTVDGRAALVFADVKGRADSIDDRAEHRLRADIFTLTIYFRLFIAGLFPEYDKAVYLDADVVVQGDISALYNTELGEDLLGAVQDHSIIHSTPLVSYVQNVVAVPIDEYFNSGVLLMNLKGLREVHLDARFLELLNRYHVETVAPDQDYLNFMCNGRVRYLDPTWNRMATGGEAPSDPMPKLVHYNLYQKPWLVHDAPYEGCFWQYAVQSIFYPEILAIKASKTLQDEKRDHEKMVLLVENAVKIEKTAKVTFASLLKNGTEERLHRSERKECRVLSESMLLAKATV